MGVSLSRFGIGPAGVQHAPTSSHSMVQVAADEGDEKIRVRTVVDGVMSLTPVSPLFQSARWYPALLGGPTRNLKDGSHNCCKDDQDHWFVPDGFESSHIENHV